MSWFGSASEWKEGLSTSALSKVEELENQVSQSVSQSMWYETESFLVSESVLCP